MTQAIWQTSQESEGERVPIVIRMSTCCFVCPGLLHARYTDVLYTMIIKTELWTRVHSPVVRAADCRSAGPWFNSGWRSWFTFMT